MSHNYIIATAKYKILEENKMKNFYCSEVTVADVRAIKLLSPYSNCNFYFNLSDSAFSFVQSSSSPMAFVAEKFGVQLLLLYTKENRNEFFIPESYSTEEREQILKKFHETTK